MGLGFCGFLALGAYGWKATLERAGVRAGWDTVLENTVQLATGEVAIVVSEKFDEHWTLKAAKWGGKAVLAAPETWRKLCGREGWLIFEGLS